MLKFFGLFSKSGLTSLSFGAVIFFCAMAGAGATFFSFAFALAFAFNCFLLFGYKYKILDQVSLRNAFLSLV